MSLASVELEMLACPRCRGALRTAAETLACCDCPATYQLRRGVPDLLPWSGDKPGGEWTRWREKLDLLEEWRNNTWNHSEESDAQQQVADDLAGRFFGFVRVTADGTVLEIGCGTGDLRPYVPSNPYWGLDPLFTQPEAAASPVQSAIPSAATQFLRGVGECLPFADASFDSVLLCQTLDHCLDPGQVVREAHRVLKAGGLLGIMQSLNVVTPSPPAAARLRAAAGRMKSRLLGQWRPDAADTKTNPLGRDDLPALLEFGLNVEETVTHGAVMFLRAVKRQASSAGAGQKDAGG